MLSCVGGTTPLVERRGQRQEFKHMACLARVRNCMVQKRVQLRFEVPIHQKACEKLWCGAPEGNRRREACLFLSRIVHVQQTACHQRKAAQAFDWRGQLQPNPTPIECSRQSRRKQVQSGFGARVGARHASPGLEYCMNVFMCLAIHSPLEQGTSNAD